MGEAKRRRASAACDARQRACGWDADGAPTNESPLERRWQRWIRAGDPPEKPWVPSPPPAPPPVVLATYGGILPTVPGSTPFQEIRIQARVGDTWVQGRLLAVHMRFRETDPLRSYFVVTRSDDEDAVPTGMRFYVSDDDWAVYERDAAQRDEEDRRARRRLATERQVVRGLPLLLTLAILASGSGDDGG